MTVRNRIRVRPLASNVEATYHAEREGSDPGSGYFAGARKSLWQPPQ